MRPVSSTSATSTTLMRERVRFAATPSTVPTRVATSPIGASSMVRACEKSR